MASKPLARRQRAEQLANEVRDMLGLRFTLRDKEAADLIEAALCEEGARLREALEPLVANLHEVAIDPERPSWHAELAAAEAAILAVPERLE